MTFKEQLAADNRKIFLSTEEFGELHMVNGKKIATLIDNNELVDREKRYWKQEDGYGASIYRKQLLIYVKAEDFGALPAVGRQFTFDGGNYTVSDAINEAGLYSICLEANRT